MDVVYWKRRHDGAGGDEGNAKMKKLLMLLVVATMACCAEAKDKVLFFVAHPDDTLACAGTMFLMKDQFELHVGVMTHGERGLGTKGFLDGSTKATRTKEEEAAAAMVGAKVHWFNEIDGDAYPNREVCRQAADLLRELKPRAIIAMWPLDYHLDHAMSSACILKAIGLVGMREVLELYFMEQSYDTPTFMPAYFVDVSEVKEQKRAFIRQHVCQNKNDRMCALEMADAAMRAQRCATYNVLGKGAGDGMRGCVERFAVWDGKPQGSRCIFNELPPPKGWRQDWPMAKPSVWTPEGGMK